MWNTLINWVQRSIWGSSDDATEPSPLPFLEHGEDGAALDIAATEPTPYNGVFFERLPPDLRRMVLIEAFGARAVHVDLRWRRPLGARPRNKTGMHAGGASVSDGGAPAYYRAVQPRGWRWYSCVCHRDPVWFVGRWRGARMGRLASHPALDGCLWGGTQSCGHPPGDPGDISRCFLGVTGWLLACRQAYIEGMDVLFSTNRFHITGTALMMELPRLLPPKAVSDIHSVELCWSLGLVAQPPDPNLDVSAEPRFRGWYLFMNLLDQIPQSLPNLRHLHLTLRGDWFPPQMAANDLLRHSDPAMLQPLDKMVRKLYESSRWSSRRYVVAIPANIFQVMVSLDVDTGAVEDQPDIAFEQTPQRKFVWRPLNGRSASRAPLEDELGYWLEENLDGKNVSMPAPVWRGDHEPLPTVALAARDW